jgi:N-acetylmuramoyl-L-alanine amidase
VRIVDHKLIGVTMKVEQIPDKWTPEFKGPPRIAVIHYAVTESAGVTADVLKARDQGDKDYASCHVTIDSTGRVIQMVPFNRRANHAGPSTYDGLSDVGAFSLGIEISNPGPLIKQPDGSLRTSYGKRWDGGAVEAFHKGGLAPKNWTHWAEYSQVELDLCAHICALWKREYGIVDVVGHDEIAPGRKFDPGPAFPMDWLRETIFPGHKTDPAPAP